MSTIFVAKLGDIVSDRGIIVGPGHPNITINGIPAAASGDLILPHACCPEPECEIHCEALLDIGMLFPNITLNGEPIIVQGDLATCEEPINRQGKIFSAVTVL